MIEETYTDALGQRRRVAPEVRHAVLAAMGLDRSDGPNDERSVAVVRPGAPLPAGGVVTLEDGTDLGRVERLAADAPFGYHHLQRDDGIDQLLLCGPGRCHLPPGVRAWGWAVQLATLRSRRSWGIGDLGDLRRFAAFAARTGAGFVGVSPLGAPNPGRRPEASPYYPSTRRFTNPLHLDVGSLAAAGEFDDLRTRGLSLNDARVVARERVWTLKRAALERLWASAARDDRALAEWRSDRGVPLERWAAFAVLSERHGPGWRTWPTEYRDPAAGAIGRLVDEARDDIAFHAWVQWQLDRQLAAASAELPRIADMPVGVDPGGFDAWDWQAALAADASVGAPPDRFNTRGQDWGLPPFVPHLLREQHYAPFIETIRAQLRHAGGLRIDHVLGLFRLWWIPRGNDPTRGAYVRYPTDELLEIVAIESHRAAALIVGEDLGTVPPGVRRELRRRKVLSTRLALFEREAPDRYPKQSLAAVTTHDLPTVAGLWSGADLADQAAAGIAADKKGAALLRSRLSRAAGVDPNASLEQVTGGVHARLAESPAMLVVATLEDALGVERRPNVPGTTDERPENWSLALPKTLEELESDPGVRSVAGALRR